MKPVGADERPRGLAERQFQILITDRIWFLQWTLLGPVNGRPQVRASAAFVRKSEFWRRLRRFTFGLFERLLGRERPATPAPVNSEPEFAAWAHDVIRADWNTTYSEIAESGSFLGYLSGYLSGQLALPVERVERMGLDDYDRALRYKLGFGLDEPNELRRAVNAGGAGVGGLAGTAPTGEYTPGMPSPERLAAIAYARESAAKWTAVYDEQGERAGRPYEIARQLFGRQVVAALEAGESVEQLRSRLVFPDLIGMLEAGRISEAEYEQLSSTIVNRDWQRFAMTEAAYAWNAGRTRARADQGVITGRPRYLRFERGVGEPVL